jgi:hypothetical protein
MIWSVGVNIAAKGIIMLVEAASPQEARTKARRKQVLEQSDPEEVIVTVVGPVEQA